MRRSVLILVLAAVLLIGAAGLSVWFVRGRAETFRVTVVEGLTVPQMLESLSGQTGFTVEEFSAPLLDGTVVSDLHTSSPRGLRDWEGLLFPDTYEVTDRLPPAEILQRLADTAEARVGSIDWGYLEVRGMSRYEGIVVASMVEREAAVDRDRPLIASVVYNRLEIGMPLQIDATVIYALGGYPEGGLTLEDLQVDSPYNTYTTRGLPPTPIAGPGLASLQAAAAPADTEYLFYVLAGEDGSHAFTDDFEEFRRIQQQAREEGILP